MHLRSHKRLFARKSNPLLIFPLGLAVIVSAMPANALAFETSLTDRWEATLVAPVRIARPELKIAEFSVLSHDTSPSSPQAVVARAVPITEVGVRSAPTETVLVPTKVASAVPVALPVSNDGPIVTLEGEASYYSRAGCLGCDPAMIMANGQPLDDSRLTMAIGANLKHLVGRRAQVTSLVTGKSVMVLITDTGGFYQAKYGSRVADLTVATKTAIGMRGGVGQVRVEVF